MQVFFKTKKTEAYSYWGVAKAKEERGRQVIQNLSSASLGLGELSLKTNKKPKTKKQTKNQTKQKRKELRKKQNEAMPQIPQTSPRSCLRANPRVYADVPSRESPCAPNNVTQTLLLALRRTPDPSVSHCNQSIRAEPSRKREEQNLRDSKGCCSIPTPLSNPC